MALALVAGLLAGALMSLAAAAIRTDTAYRRFLDSHRSSDYVIANGLVGRSVDLDAIARLPGVATTARLKDLVANGRTSSGRRISASQMGVRAPADEHLGRAVDQWKLLSGRRADPRRAGEAVVAFEFARRFHVRVGDSIVLSFQKESTVGELLSNFAATLTDHIADRTARLTSDNVFDGPKISVRVVGIEASPYEFPPLSGPPSLALTPAFYDRYADGLFHSDEMHVRLRPGVDPAAFWKGVLGVSQGLGPAQPRARAFEYATVQPPLHLEAVVLWGLAALIGVVVCVSLALALTRAHAGASGDFSLLQALGMTRWQLLAVGALRAARFGIVSALVAVVTAWALSPLWPIGIARDAEPHPGFAVNGAVLAIGSFALVFFSICVGVAATIGVTRKHAASNPRPSAWRRKVRRALPFTVGLGFENATRSGRGRDGVSARTAIFALSLATAVVVIVTIFAASTTHLLATPRLYGWARTGDINTGGLPGLAEPIIAGLKKNPDVRAIATDGVAVVYVGGGGVVAQGLDNVQGKVPPALLEGRDIRADDEIILGSQTMSDAGVRLGDRVTVRTAARTLRMRVVGRAAFTGDGDFKPDSDHGAQVTLATLRSLVPNTPAGDIQFMVRRHADVARTVSHLQEAVAPLAVYGPSPPDETIGFGGATQLPAAVALMMTLIAASTVAYTMATSVRRRSHDFAVLASLGCLRRQLGSIVLAQAVVMSVLACAIGVPLGLIGGRWVWNAVADALTVTSDVRNPSAAIALVIAGVVVLTASIAVIPAAVARRIRPSSVLQAE